MPCTVSSSTICFGVAGTILCYIGAPIGHPCRNCMKETASGITLAGHFRMIGCSVSFSKKKNTTYPKPKLLLNNVEQKLSCTSQMGLLSYATIQYLVLFSCELGSLCGEPCCHKDTKVIECSINWKFLCNTKCLRLVGNVPITS